MDGILAQVFTLLLLLISLPHVVTRTCGVGENCGNGCTCVPGSRCGNVTGVCTCNTGLDGPTCNRRNIALGRPAVQPSTYKADSRFAADKAVDGRVGHILETTPCTHTNNEDNPSWQVTLNSTYSIYRFQIYNRNVGCAGHLCGSRLNGFTLSVGNSSSGYYGVCYRDKTSSNYGPGDIIDGVCDNSPIPGDTVRITLPGYATLTLCEVKLFVCTPGTYGPLCTQTCGFCAGGRQVCDSISGDCPDTSPRCLQQFAGPKCKVCTPGTYGPLCTQTCGFCAGGRQVCDGTSGDCPDTDPRCQEPYAGPKCKGCTQGWYGENCQRCGFCAYGRTVCDTTSGDCPDRSPTCMAGYTGTRCDTACSAGRYGPDCNQTCGFCDGRRTVCDSTSGRCPGKQPRCMAGYSGLKCDTECSNNTWGADCKKPCGNCYNGTTCHMTSGDCPVTAGSSRCMSGYIGKLCSTRGSPSPSPAVVGGAVSGSVVLVILVAVVAIVISRRRKGRGLKTNIKELEQREPDGQICQPSYDVREEGEDVYENEIEMTQEDDFVNSNPNSNTAQDQEFGDYAVLKKN